MVPNCGLAIASLPSHFSAVRSSKLVGRSAAGTSVVLTMSNGHGLRMPARYDLEAASSLGIRPPLARHRNRRGLFVRAVSC